VPDGPGHVFLFNCRTFELYTFDATRAKHAAPHTVEEIVLLVASALTPKGRLEPDAEGEAVLQRILDRDATVIPLLESDFRGYALRATELDEELMSADEAKARREVHAGDSEYRGICGADGGGARGPPGDGFA
jgi:hypothetical protein